jgi:hypothetical protein
MNATLIVQAARRKGDNAMKEEKGKKNRIFHF